MKTLDTAYRVSELTASLNLYATLGYREVGRVELGDGASLTLLKFPDNVVALELAYRPTAGDVELDKGFSRVVVQVDDMSTTVEALTSLDCGPSRWITATRQTGRQRLG